VKLRPILLVAAVLVIAFGMVGVLLPPGIPSAQEGEQPTTGISPATIAGILAVLIGLALLILGLLNPASVRGTAKVPEVPQSMPISQAPSPPSPMSSDTEAALVRLLDDNERLLYVRLRDAGGVALQRDIVAWRTFSPAKVSRILDRLEAKGLLVRERHGATNRVRLVRQALISQK